MSIANNDADEMPYNFDISGLGLAPEIDIQGGGVSIADGDMTPTPEDDTDFGSVATADGTLPRTFSIHNTGNHVLNLNANAVSVAGAGADDFSITSQPATTVAAGDSTSFTIAFDPSEDGARQASVVVANDDANEAPYNFDIVGVGATPLPDEGVINEIILPFRSLFDRLSRLDHFSGFRDLAVLHVERTVTVTDGGLLRLDSVLHDLWTSLRNADAGTDDVNNVLANFEDLLLSFIARELGADTAADDDDQAATPGIPQAFAKPFSQQLLMADRFERERRALWAALA